ncbi:Diguanylate cyclase [Candidatus Terasakiella magnetica]|nr:Diguanylate cyclase [Candidatus Terasakiella magnetica]
MAAKTDDIAPHFRAESIFAELSAYQHALSNHTDWLRYWYSSVLTRTDSGASPIAPITCALDTWMAQATSEMLGGYSEFATIRELHAEIHEKADRMTARTNAGQATTTSDYEAMMSLVLAFSAAAQNLEREVWRTLATVDPLTGLGNRQTMMTHLIGERDRAIRLEQPCCVGLADVDNFKKINDTWGHATGDQVLCAVADCLRTAVRPYDVVYRYGGEEFLICLPAATSEAGFQVLERMRMAVEALELTTHKGNVIRITVTFGLADLTADLSVEESLERADNALYDGKRLGKNRVMLYQPRE